MIEPGQGTNKINLHSSISECSNVYLAGLFFQDNFCGCKDFLSSNVSFIYTIFKKKIAIVLIYSLGKRKRENMNANARNYLEIESLIPEEEGRTLTGVYLDLLSHQTFHSRI